MGSDSVGLGKSNSQPTYINASARHFLTKGRSICGHCPILNITLRPSERVPAPVPAGGCLLVSENTNRDESCPQTIVPSPCENVRLTIAVPRHSTPVLVCPLIVPRRVMLLTKAFPEKESVPSAV